MDSFDNEENELYDSDMSMEEIEEEEKSDDMEDMLTSSFIKLQFNEIAKECHFSEEELFQSDPFFIKYDIKSIKDLLSLLFEHFKSLDDIDVALSKEKWEEHQRNRSDKDNNTEKLKKKKGFMLDNNFFDATEFWIKYFGSDSNDHPDINLLYNEFKENIIFKFVKPKNMVLLGSHALNTVSKPNYNVDVGIILPSSIWKDKDVKGHRYYMKRLLYLAVLEKTLHSSKYFNFKILSKFAFNSIEEYNMPHLNISFHNKSKFSINIWPILDGDSIKWPKLNPNKFHMRYFNSTNVIMKPKDPESYFSPVDEKILDIWHNNDIASDILKIAHVIEKERIFAHSKDFRDALIMLKLWSRKRNLYSKLNGFVLSMLIHYLLLSRHLTADMKAYEIFLSVLKFFASDTIIKEGIDYSSLEINDNLYENCGITPPPKLEPEEKKVWKELCDVVFLDRSGHVNFLCRHSKALWLSIQHYAKESLCYIENESVESVNLLFLKKYVPFLESDVMIRLKNIGKDDSMETEESEQQVKLIPRLLSDLIILRILKMEKMLLKGLETRVNRLKIITPDRLYIDSKNNTYTETTFEWGIHAPMNFLNENMQFILFLDVNSENWKKLINHGPPAQSPQAESFIEFWGKEKSGLRRFKDGQILHCSVWGDDDPLISSSMNYRHQIIVKIIQHLMKRHYNIDHDSIELISSFFDSILLCRGPKNETEHSSLVNDMLVKNYNELETLLSNLDISLSVKSVRGIGSIMRSTHPSPSLYNKLIDNQFLISKSNYHTISNICPMPIDVIVQLEPSSKWPDDLEGISALKTSFYFEMKESFLKQYNVKSIVLEKYLEVYFKGYVWHIDIYHPREIELIRRIDENESIKSNFYYKESTRITSLIRSLSIQHQSYAPTCKIVKSWLASQLLPLESFDDGLLIDLIVAYLYMPQNEYHFIPPQHYVSGFLRTLNLLGSHNWSEDPLILNFDNIFTSEDCDHIQREYMNLREDLRPTIRITYPGSEKKEPHHYQYPHSYNNRNIKEYADNVLERIQKLAIKAKNDVLRIIAKFEEEKKIESIFSPPLTDFDIIILLNKNMSYNYFRDKISKSSTPKISKSVVEMAKSIHKDEFMPILPGFNPVKNFIEELDILFGDRSYIYHDGYIGNIIGLVWKPSAFYISGGLKLNYMSHVLPVKRKKKSKSGAVLNIFQILSDIKKSGEGIIKDVYFVSGSHNL